jgi:hypothetical protein
VDHRFEMKPTVAALAGLGFVMTLTASTTAQPGPDRRLLAPSYPISKLREILLTREAWRPYPNASNPVGLERVPARVRQAYIDEGVRRLEGDWTPLPPSVFLEYIRTGDRSHYEALSFARRARLAHLVLAELFERKGRFLDQIVNGVWALSEESFWGVPAHLGLQRAGPGLPDVSEPVVDLFAAETGALMAWTSYLLGPELDRVHPLITRRMTLETERRILRPYLEREDWGYLGYTWRRRTGYVRPVNNWNPWINSNVLTAALILEQDPDRRVALVHKVMETLDAFVEPYPADGGCDEGPSYWNRAGGSLFDVLDLLHSASAGRIDVFDTPLIRAIGQYIDKTYIAGRYFIDFADASAKIDLEAPLVYRFGRAIGDEEMMGFAAFAAREQHHGDGVLPASFGVLGRVLPALFSLEALAAQPAVEPLFSDVWLPDVQVMAARSVPGRRDGFYLAAKGGHNDESHNHNDVGNFIAYYDGKPLLIDAGAQTYTATTFSSRRYELWNNQSGFHNLPTINDVMQHEGRSFAARDLHYEAGADFARLSLDLAGAYPKTAHVESWQRTLTLHRGQDVEVEENYRLAAFTSPFTLNFLTPLRADAAGAGRVRLSNPDTAESRAFVLVFDAARFDPTVETIPITDTRMRGSWGDTLQRVVLRSKRTGLIDRFSVRLKVE